MRTLTAFVARSFSPSDDRKIKPILDHLDTFRNLGFVWKSAEPAEVESVSEKVQRIIAECEVFVGVLSQRHPIFRFANPLGDAWRILRRELKPAQWSAPPWVLQEVGFALGLQKKVILFVETQLDLPALQGDLEYIPYDHLDPTDAFLRSSSMIVGLIAKRDGLAVETVVREGAAEAQAPEKASAEATEAPPQTAAAEPLLTDVVFRFFEALEKKDFSAADEQEEAGLKVIAAGRTSMTELSWKCFCLSDRYVAGDTEAIEKLRALQEANPQDQAPSMQIGRALMEFKEFEQAARYFERAGEISQRDSERVHNVLRAADAYVQAKMVHRAESILVGMLDGAGPESREQASQKLYDILKCSSDIYAAFGLAEATLRNNPALTSFRFRLGLDYNEKNQDALFLYHYSLLQEHDPNGAGVIHNLALAFSSCDLPMKSVSYYKKGIELGETLSANNLARKYLDAGIVDETQAMLMDALKKPDVDARVGQCLGELRDRQEREEKKYASVMEAANEQRSFLIAVGEGRFQSVVPVIAGRWLMPFGEMELQQTSEVLKGTAQKAEKASAFSTLLGGPKEKIRTFTLIGSMKGAACTFRLTSGFGETPEEILSAGPDTVDGVLVFGPEGKTGRYAEIKERGLSNFAPITRLPGT